MSAYQKYGLVLSVFLVLFLGFSFSAYAQSVNFPYWPSSDTPIISCTGDYSNYQGNASTTPQCLSLCDMVSTFQRILYFVMTLILFIGAPLMFVVGGGMIFFAGPNPSFLEQGRKVIWGAVIGVVLALSSYVIIGTFLWLIGNPSSGQRVSWPDISCNPQQVPGGSLNLWGGNATSGGIPGDSGSGNSSSSRIWSGCMLEVIGPNYKRCRFKEGAPCQWVQDEGFTCEAGSACVTGATGQECEDKIP
ncbi:MAG TPA: hypothetical protein VJL32_00830 [Candidatus Paceibacterota bacterium]